MPIYKWTFSRTHDRLDPRCDQRLYKLYQHRQMLEVLGVKYSRGPQVSVMTYNILYPSLEQEKWNDKYFDSNRLRERVIMCEIGRYNPDILCLQEVPVDEDYSWWEAQLFSLGYESTFAYTGNKTKGIGISFKYDLFSEISHDVSNFDLPLDNALGSSCTIETKGSRAMLLLCLGFTEKFLRSNRSPSRHGIIVGSTHLASGDRGRYDKMAQIGYYARRASKFASHIRFETNSNSQFYTFLAGDFNTRRFDPKCSYKKLIHEPEKVDFMNQCMEDMLQEIDCLDQVRKYVREILSLYSIAYGSLRNDINIEDIWPFIDHIFVVCDRTHMENKPYILKSLEDLTKLGGLRLLALLRIPTKSEAGPTRKCQPVIGQFPSDHMCLMADLELL